MRNSRPLADAAPLPSAPPAQPNTRLNSSGARLEPPMPSTAARRYPSSRMSRARCSSSGIRADIDSGRSSHPSHAATSSGGLPEAAHSDPSLAQSRSATRSSVHAWRRAAIAPSRAALMSGPSCGGQLLPLRLDRLDQLVEALREARHALVDELAGHAFHRDSLRLDRADRLARSVQVAVERALDGAVVEECGDGLDRHGVDCLGTDEALDVEHVSVCGVLRARARPQAALDAGTRRAEIGELVAAEDLGER